MKNRIYLVKSGSRILGPFTPKTVIEQLKSRQLVPLDEVVEPNGFWHYLRDDKRFKKAIEEISIQNIGLTENTETSSIPIQSTLTDIEPLLEESTTSGSASAKPVVSYAYEGDESIQSKAGLSVKIFWFSAVLLLVSSLSFLFYKFLIESPKVKAAQVAKLKEIAYKNINLGHYEKALESFERASTLNKEDRSYYPDLSLLLARMGEASHARRYLASTQIENDDIKNRFTHGLILFHEQKFDESAEIFESLTTGKYKYPAVVNTTLIYIARKEYSKANTHLTSYTEMMNSYPLLALLLAEVNIKNWERTRDSSYLIQTQDVLRDSVIISDRYYQESLILRSYVSYLLKNFDQQRRLVEIALDFDPKQVSNFRENIYIPQKSLSASLISQWCLSMLSGDNALFVAGRALCLHKVNKNTAALSAIRLAVSLKPKNTLILSMYAYLLMNEGLLNKAKVELKLALSANANKYIFPLILKARFCEINENQRCASKAWRKLYRRESSYLFSISGMINHYMSRGQWNRAYELLAEGMQLSENYQEFISQNMILSQKPER